MLVFSDAMDLHRELSNAASVEEKYRIVLLEGISQSMIAAVGSSLVIDPILFLSYLNSTCSVIGQAGLSFPVFSHGTMHEGRLSVVVDRASKPTTGTPLQRQLW